MIQKIYKGSDIMVALSLKDAEGTPYKISTTNEFTIGNSDMVHIT